MIWMDPSYKLPEPFRCCDCGADLGYSVATKATTELVDRGAVPVCTRCYAKRIRRELGIRLEQVVDKLRALGYDAQAMIDGEEV